MYLAKLNDHIIGPGSELEITGVDNFKFKVLKVQSKSFDIEWLVGDNIGKKDSVPFSLFDSVGHPIELVELSDCPDEPNRAFLAKKMEA